MDIQILSFQQNKSISLVQFETTTKNSFEYISGSKALKEKKIEIREISEAGNVNMLAVINFSKEFVFFSDGDILTGAKQNRTLNTSILLLPDSKTTIPVSCIESGRWRYKKPDFSDSEFFIPAIMRSAKSQKVKENLKARKMYDADQGEIWRLVSEYENIHSSHSMTSDLNAIYEKKHEDIDSLIKNFNADKEANGIAVFLNKKLISVDIFNRHDIYSEYFDKLLKSVSFEMYRIKNDNLLISESEAKYRTLDFIDNIEKLPVEYHEGVGAGRERRFSSEHITGFELIYQNHSIHLSAVSNIKEL